MESQKTLGSQRLQNNTLTPSLNSPKQSQIKAKSPNFSKLSNKTPQKLDPVMSQLANIKSTHDFEIRYMQEYISILKKKNLSNPELVNEKKLRDEISFLYDQLKHEQQVNLKLLEELNYLGVAKNEGLGNNSEDLIIMNQNFDTFKEEYIRKVEDCLGFYIRQLSKGEEKMNRLELSLELLKKEAKMIKSVIFANYKKDLLEKMEEIKENRDILGKVTGENMNLKEKITELQRDVQFYKDEIKKQREIVREFTEENDFERKTLANINSIKGGEMFEIDKHELFDEMMEKVPGVCVNCESKIQELTKNEKRIELLEGQVFKLKGENKKLVEDNENLELITGKLQDIIISSDINRPELKTIY